MKKIKLMCCKKFLKRIVPFLAFLLVGVFSENLFISKEKQGIKQNYLTQQSISVVSNPTNLSVCNDKNSLIKEKFEIQKWLVENKNASKSQRFYMEKELKELQEKLDVIKKSEELENNSKEEQVGKKLVLKQICY